MTKLNEEKFQSEVVNLASNMYASSILQGGRSAFPVNTEDESYSREEIEQS